MVEKEFSSQLGGRTRKKESIQPKGHTSNTLRTDFIIPPIIRHYANWGKEIRAKHDTPTQSQILALSASTSGHGSDVDKTNTSGLHAQGGSALENRDLKQTFDSLGPVPHHSAS